MKAFRLFLDKAPTEIASKTFLYLHTSYPEKNGWDIPDGIMQNKLGGKVLMTYICKNCRQFFPSLFQDALAKCKFCNQVSAVCPTVSYGISVPDLAKIYNLFDIYVQYAICEGFGMPQVEAAACGVPIAATNYSAMRDVIKFTKGYPIDVKTFFREIETNAERAYPDNNILAKILIKFFSQTSNQRMTQSMNVRKSTLKRYGWDKSAKVWEDYIDSYIPTGFQGQWNAPAQMHNVPGSIPANLSNEEFIRWIFHDVARKPEKLHQQEGVRLYRDFEFGAQMGQGVLEPIDRDKIFASYHNKAVNKNEIEHARSANLKLSDAFIAAAHQMQGAQP